MFRSCHKSDFLLTFKDFLFIISLQLPKTIEVIYEPNQLSPALRQPLSNSTLATVTMQLVCTLLNNQWINKGFGKTMLYVPIPIISLASRYFHCSSFKQLPNKVYPLYVVSRISEPFFHAGWPTQNTTFAFATHGECGNPSHPPFQIDTEDISCNSLRHFRLLRTRHSFDWGRAAAVRF